MFDFFSVLLFLFISFFFGGGAILGVPAAALPAQKAHTRRAAAVGLSAPAHKRLRALPLMGVRFYPSRTPPPLGSSQSYCSLFYIHQTQKQMQMLKNTTAAIAFWAALHNFAIAQDIPQEPLVLEAVFKVFNGMRQADTTLFKSAFHPEARFVSTMTQNGTTVYKIDQLPAFIKAIANPHGDVWDERIAHYSVKIDDGVANVWTDYSFFIGSKFSHCGANSISLINTDAGWKIIEIADTRRIAPCAEQRDEEITKKNIDNMLDQWHNAATTADEKTFFGLMTETAIYLGTDASERWLRDELKNWSKKYFDRESAWEFKAISRQVYLHTSGNVAWFEESLDTKNMGECRGSGVVLHTPDGWRIQHYNLALPVPNEKMDAVQKLLGKKKN